MQIYERLTAWRNRGELQRQEITHEAEQLTTAIQPYVDVIGYLPPDLTMIRGTDPIAATKFCSIFLRRKEGNKLVCWFLQSDGSGFKTGDLQITMAYQPANPLSFETIEVFKLPRKEEKYWLPLKPANQLENLKLANECLGIVKNIRAGTEIPGGGGGGLLFQPKETG